MYGCLMEAARNLGYPLTEDSNGHVYEGVGPADSMLHNGVRCSPAQAYLHPVLQRDNLTVLCHAAVTKVIVENQTATGKTLT